MTNSATRLSDRAPKTTGNDLVLIDRDGLYSGAGPPFGRHAPVQLLLILQH